MLELDPRLLCGEAPVYGTLVGVTLGFPGTHFLGKCLLVGMRLSKHWRASTESSISAMFSHEPCFGV